MALAEIHAEIESKRSKRWEYTAKYLQKLLKKDISYSSKSCQKRFVALQDDKARIPPELDDDPEKRARDRAQKSLARLQRKQAREEAANAEKERKKLAADQKRIGKLQQMQANADKRREELEKRAAAASDKANKHKSIIEEQRRKRDAENAEIERLRQGIASGQSSTPSTSLKTLKKPTPRKTKVPASQNPLGSENPRQKLTVEELQDLCVKRGLSKAGNKTVLMNKLAENDAGLSDLALNTMLLERNCLTEGTREDRLTRLAMADASQSNWAKKHRFVGAFGKKRGKSVITDEAGSEADTERSPSKRIRATTMPAHNSINRFGFEARNVAVIAEEANVDNDGTADSDDDADVPQAAVENGEVDAVESEDDN
jgi:SAP domain